MRRRAFRRGVPKKLRTKARRAVKRAFGLSRTELDRIAAGHLQPPAGYSEIMRRLGGRVAGEQRDTS